MSLKRSIDGIDNVLISDMSGYGYTAILFDDLVASFIQETGLSSDVIRVFGQPSSGIMSNIDYIVFNLFYRSVN